MGFYCRSSFLSCILLIDLWVNQNYVQCFGCGCSLGLYGGAVVCLLPFLSPTVIVTFCLHFLSAREHRTDVCKEVSTRSPRSFLEWLFIIYHSVCAIRVFFPPTCIPVRLSIINDAWFYVAESLSIQYDDAFWSIDCSKRFPSSANLAASLLIPSSRSFVNVVKRTSSSADPWSLPWWKQFITTLQQIINLLKNFHPYDNSVSLRAFRERDVVKTLWLLEIQEHYSNPHSPPCWLLSGTVPSSISSAHSSL